MTKAQRLGQSQISNKRFLSFWSPLINRSSVFIGKEWVVNSTDVRVRGKLSSLRQFYTNLFVGGLWSQLHKSMVSDFFAVVARQQEAFSDVGEARILQNHADKPLNIYGVH